MEPDETGEHLVRIVIIIKIHLFYKVPFKALRVAVQHIKNGSKDTIKKGGQLKSRKVSFEVGFE